MGSIQSVRSWLGDNPRMIVQDVRRMAISILEGLVEIHGMGLVHGDIKDDQWFLDDAYAAPISGIARANGTWIIFSNVLARIAEYDLAGGWRTGTCESGNRR